MTETALDRALTAMDAAPDDTTATCWPARQRAAMSAAIPVSQSRRTAPPSSTSNADPILTISRGQEAGANNMRAR